MNYFQTSVKLLCGLFISTLFFLPYSVSASIPTLQDSFKRAPQTKSASRAPQIVKKTSLPVLGIYRDISLKRRGISPATNNSDRKIKRKISARSAIIIDAVTGKTLFSRAPDRPRQPASTIKVITGMIAMKSLSETDKVAVSPKAARQPRSKIYLDHKKNYKAADLIQAVLLASANDASVALAEKIAGNEKEFAQMMTLRARLWGAKNTICQTASGLTAKGQQSTARDLATIFRHVMADDDFAAIMKKTKARTTRGKLLRNHNKALWQIKGAEGGKTGYTNKARQTYVGKFKRGGNEIIVAIMGSETMWTDIKRLVEYGFTHSFANNSVPVDNKSAQPAQLIAGR
ncbi:MAG: serine hydrolase [Thermodesulfobacteriota bacterium]